MQERGWGWKEEGGRLCTSRGEGKGEKGGDIRGRKEVGAGVDDEAAAVSAKAQGASGGGGGDVVSFTTTMSSSFFTSSIAASSPVRASALRFNCPLRFSSAWLFIPVADADTAAATCGYLAVRPQRTIAAPRPDW
jgi:hypothetical protein